MVTLVLTTVLFQRPGRHASRAAGDGDESLLVGTVVTTGAADDPHELRMAAPAIAIAPERTSVRTPILPIPGRSVAPAHRWSAGGADCSIVGSHRPGGTITSRQAVPDDEGKHMVTRKTTPIDDGAEAPPRGASFEDKMAYYRSQHTTVGVRATHLVGIPAVAAALPLIAARPRVGLPLFLAGWSLQVLGHKVFEGNSPALTKGIFTYQFCGLAFWCEEMADLIAGRSPLTGKRQSGSDDADDGPGIPVGDFTRGR